MRNILHCDGCGSVCCFRAAKALRPSPYEPPGNGLHSHRTSHSRHGRDFASPCGRPANALHSRRTSRSGHDWGSPSLSERLLSDLPNHQTSRLLSCARSFADCDAAHHANCRNPRRPRMTGWNGASPNGWSGGNHHLLHNATGCCHAWSCCGCGHHHNHIRENFLA